MENIKTDNNTRFSTVSKLLSEDLASLPKDKIPSKIEPSFNYFRKSYVDGAITPLFRGILHMIVSISMIIFNIMYFWQMGILKIISMMLIFSSYLFSTILHCVRLPEKKEMMVNVIDHIAIHHHIFACLLVFISSELIFYILCGIFILNYYVDAFYALKRGYNYLFTTRHISHYVVSMSIALMNAINYIKYLSSPFSIFLVFVAYGLYVSGQIIYVINRNNTKENKIWSYHETFHLFVTGGTVVTVYLMFNTS